MRILRVFRALPIVLLALSSLAAQKQKQEPPEPRPLGKVEFPSYETHKLANGLTVYALEHREQPVVAIRLLLAAGSANDPKDLPGVASFTAGLLDQGTKTRSARKIAEEIDFVGGSLSAGAEADGIFVSSTVLTDSVDLGFELLSDVVMNPAFAEEELERQRQMALSGLTASMDDPEFLADAVFDRVIYGDHPYAHPEGGTLESIPGIRREDVVRFHQTYFAPNISSIAIVGDLPSKNAFDLAEKWFGKWPRKDVPRPDKLETPQTTGRRIVVVDMPDNVQTEIRVGHLAVPRKDPDYFRLLMASYILGGGSSGRLFQTLRAEKGLTYGAYSTIRPRKGPGSFYAVTATRTEKTREAIDLIFEEMEKLRETIVPGNEMNDARAFLIGSFPLTIETPSDLATRLTNVALYELGEDYLGTYRDKLAAVSGAEVLKVAKERVRPSDAAIILVGNASGFQKAVAALGKLEVIPAAKLDLGSSRLQKD